jgi:glycosyltransferase involved in cell wall biosynthesis
MKILLSAYACEPWKGSEPGVGWHWALELARQGHEVTVLTRANNREPIEVALKSHVPKGLQFFYYDLPRWAMWWKKGARGVHLYYQLWQIGSYLKIRRVFDTNSFDVVHHLTFGGIRQASFLGRIGIPLIVGPLGGGDYAPAKLMKTFPVSGRLSEAVRYIWNKLSRLDPTFRQMLRRADVIYCKTLQTKHALPSRYQAKCIIALEIGVDASWIAKNILVPLTPDFLSVGRLLYLKGTHLTLDAFAGVLNQRKDATLTIVGAGPAEQWLKARAERLGIAHAVTWRGWMSQDELRKVYHESLALIFPTLRDSSGNVALEAFSAGTPVICLDLGGPAALVPASAGFRIDSAKADVKSVVADLTKAMLTLSNNHDCAVQMSEHALQYAKKKDWVSAVNGVYQPILEQFSTTALKVSETRIPSRQTPEGCDYRKKRK